MSIVTICGYLIYTSGGKIDKIPSPGLKLSANEDQYVHFVSDDQIFATTILKILIEERIK